MAETMTGLLQDLLLHDPRLLPFRVAPEEIHIDRSQLLSDGVIAKVYRCTYQRASYALKILSLIAAPGLPSRTALEEFAADEVSAMLALHGTGHAATLRGIYQPSAGGELWLMFDLINGKTFHQAFVDIWNYRRDLASQIKATTPWSVQLRQRFFWWDKFTLQILIGLLRCLEYTHSLGVAHLDLTSTNVMLYANESGTLRVRLTDFGCARLMGLLDQMTQKTGVASEQLAVSLAYVAPEVTAAIFSKLRGQPLPADMKPAVHADMYSFGLLAFELLTGTPADLFRHSPPSMWPSLPRWSDQLCRWLCACIDPTLAAHERPAAALLRDAFEQVVGNNGEDMVVPVRALQILGASDHVRNSASAFQCVCTN